VIVQPGGGGERREAKNKTKSAQQRFEIRSDEALKVGLPSRWGLANRLQRLA
jgi:hypothetical protein